MAAMMNMNNLLNGKDSRWLQLEVCREFQRNKCSRQDTECKFAHPPANVEVQNGKVTACYDSIKGRCNREKPPCKYFHPPQHLKDQLLINGRNHLALKNALMQQMAITSGQPVMPGQVPAVNGTTSVPPLGFSVTVGSQPIMATNPYLTGIPASTYSPYFAPGHLVPALLGPDPSTVASQLGPVVPQAVPVAQQKIARSDRLEVCREFMRGACKRAESECRFAHPQESVTTHEDGSVTVCMDAVKGRCARDLCRYFHPPLHLQAQIKTAQLRAVATAPVSAAAAAGPVLTAAVAAAAMTHPIPTPGAAPSTAMALGHPLEVGKKRAAENDMFQLMDMKTVGSFYYENFAFSGMVPYKRPAAEKSGIPVYQPGATTYQQLMQLQQPFVPVSSTNNIPPNAPYVIYTDSNGQLLDTLPVCQDFNRSMCNRLNCRFVHLKESDKVEVCDQRVAVCRDHANGQCKRKQCKYYHIPIVLPPANIMATIFKAQHQANGNTINSNDLLANQIVASVPNTVVANLSSSSRPTSTSSIATPKIVISSGSLLSSTTTNSAITKSSMIGSVKIVTKAVCIPSSTTFTSSSMAPTVVASEPSSSAPLQSCNVSNSIRYNHNASYTDNERYQNMKDSSDILDTAASYENAKLNFTTYRNNNNNNTCSSQVIHHSSNDNNNNIDDSDGIVAQFKVNPMNSAKDNYDNSNSLRTPKGGSSYDNMDDNSIDKLSKIATTATIAKSNY